MFDYKYFVDYKSQKKISIPTNISINHVKMQNEILQPRFSANPKARWRAQLTEVGCLEAAAKARERVRGDGRRGGCHRVCIML